MSFEHYSVVKKEFGRLLDELEACGGCEAQSLVRHKLHDLFNLQDQQRREKLLEAYRGHRMIRERWIFNYQRRTNPKLLALSA